MAVINPVGYLHNVATTTGQVDRLSAIGSQMAPNGAGLTWRQGVGGAGDLAVTAVGTPNMTVNVAAGQSFVLGTSNAFQSLYSVPNDGTVNLAIAAANATLPRWDLIIVRVQDSQYAGSLNTGTIEVVTGTAAASPSDPTTPANSLILARIVVAAAATSITSGAITDLRQWTVALGGCIPVSSSTQRDAIPKYDGLEVYRLDTHNYEYWDAGAGSWDNEILAVTTGITPASGWTVASQLLNKKGNVAVVSFNATRTGTAISTGTTGNVSNVSVATLPAGYRPIAMAPATSGGSGRMASFIVSSAGLVTLTATTPNVSIAVNEVMSVVASFPV